MPGKDVDLFSAAHRPTRRISFIKSYLPWCLSCSLLIAFFFSKTTSQPSLISNKPGYTSCQPPRPNLLGNYPPPSDAQELLAPSQVLHHYLTSRVNQPDVDSIAVAVVTPASTVFERGYGVLRANETDPDRRGKVDGDSIYRIASITKMFTVLETLILRERGVLSWDDPVDKYLTDITYPSYSWSDYLNGEKSHDAFPRITLRQLASHLAGIGRDYPPAELDNWPENSEVPEFPRRSYEDLRRSIANYPLINEPYSYPIYSNAGFDLLGLANIAANLKASNDSTTEPKTHRGLVKRDIFDPLELNSSFYRIPTDPLLVSRISVPSQNSQFAADVQEFEFDDSDDPAGGQYSSLMDLVTVMKTFLSPTAERGVISQHVVREWLRPLHTWQSWIGTFEASGGPWEIMKAGESHLYTKGGNAPGYHSQFAIHQDLSFGVIVLLTGSFTDTSSLAQKIVSWYQPAFERILKHYMSELYEGTWVTGKGGDVAVVRVLDGALYMTRLFVRGIDVLALVQNYNIGLTGKPKPVSLWNTGRLGEFRLAFGRRELNGNPLAGCFPYWVSFDPGLNSHGAPVDLIYWERDTLVYPSAGVKFQRV
ncbi:hypothetical protein AX17_000296 [Amanita inopinata Kibby_2008]|nr:hypothetical protein AX17_000296 [Amanita inopinata Kibby_2008]